MIESEQKEIMNIKKCGKLVALQVEEDSGWEYWMLDGTLYSVSSSGCSYNIWCSENNLERHLKRLYHVTGKKFFTESVGMVVIDREFIGRFKFA